jgi:hypothetical protein
VSTLLFHCHGSGMSEPAADSARWYMVSVWRTTAKVWTASNCGVSGMVMKSPNAFGLTGAMPGSPEAMRASRGPSSTMPGRNALRVPISLTDGSCFHISTRAPNANGSGTGGACSPSPRGAPGSSSNWADLRCSR